MFYALWMTPDGQRRWDGPYPSPAAAREALQRNINRKRAFIAERVADASDG